jgi:regulation of enolase protein 1 (concanavalin A-like superfamily)
MRIGLRVFVCAAMLFSAGLAEAANRTVCASGCQYSSLQAAIDAAAPGDTILLRAGETFIGNFVLRNKNTSSTAFITITSDAPAANLPAEGVRLIPEGKTGWNTRRSALARLIGPGGTGRSTPVVRTAAGAHHYRLQFLDIDGVANVGYETLVALGASTGQTSLSAVPYSLVIDRSWLHGHAVKGMKRGIYLNSRSTDILNSYFEDFFSYNEAQAISGTNGPGPFRIINNHLEGAAENIMFGGDDPQILNLVPSDIEIRGNYIVKDLSWQNIVLKTPSKPTAAVSSTTGSLAAGTHYFKVVAVLSSGGADGFSAASVETSIAAPGARAVSLSWPAVSGADKYRIYRGTSSNGQSVYLETSGTQTSFTYTGSSEKAGTPKSGSKWVVKNLLELKNAQRVTIDANVFQYNWAAGQQGYSILFTPRNQSGGAPWAVVQDVTVTNNTIRNVAAAFHILGSDDLRPSQRTRNITIRNNVAEKLDRVWGNTGRFLSIAEAPVNLVVNHNTIDGTGTVVEIMAGAVTGFVFTNNIARHNTYGIKGQNVATGNATLAAFFPGAVFKGNVLAGGAASWYPTGNFFPAAADFNPQFVSATTGDWRLTASSQYNNKATDGTDIGADIGALELAQAAAGGGAPGTGGGGGDDDDDDTPPAPLPSGWQSRDVGSVGQSGSASASGSTITVNGAGADVWGSVDGLHYAYTTLTGDGTITAQVSSIIGAQPWTKVGVMMRASTASNAAHAFMLVSTSKGLSFQRRAQTGGVSASSSGGTGTAPRWVRLTRSSNTVTAAVSTTGTTWTTVGSATIDLPATALVGLGVSSHDTTQLATATFDNVGVAAAAAPEPPQAGWQSGDVGAVGQPGSMSGSGESLTVSGAGADVWGTADGFHYAYMPLAGNGTITAQVSSMIGSDPWTKVGVMIRASTAANAAHGFMLVSTSKGLAFQRRAATGAQSANTSGGAGTAPRWVRLTRNGNVITAFVSTNGTSWTTVGTATIDLPATALIGVAVSSHDTTRLATATFENVTVEP